MRYFSLHTSGPANRPTNIAIVRAMLLNINTPQAGITQVMSLQ